MRRAVFAIVVVAGTAVPALVAAVWLFGCCVLPFHAAMHKLVPLCRIATSHREQQPATAPAGKPQRVVHRLIVAPAIHLATPRPRVIAFAASPVSYRSFISLGAVRCDDDVGLHTLLATFLI